MANNQTIEDQGTALETKIWLPLKDASAEGQCCDATIKRAIGNKKLVGRKVGPGHNASYEVTRESLDEWLAARRKSKRENSPPTPQPTAEPQATEPAATSQPAAVDAAGTPAKPKLTKAERRKLKASRKKEIPESARRLRRWKNFMRHADQQQALAMIKWLSARLNPKKSLSKKILKEALKQQKAETKTP